VGIIAAAVLVRRRRRQQRRPAPVLLECKRTVSVMRACNTLVRAKTHTHDHHPETQHPWKTPGQALTSLKYWLDLSVP
jgi:hypothetical protein